jgi:hypothetical protein
MGSRRGVSRARRAYASHPLHGGCDGTNRFVIAVGYNQVIELFPSGGGGYKVATNLIGPYTGLVSGAALLRHYPTALEGGAAKPDDQLMGTHRDTPSGSR